MTTPNAETVRNDILQRFAVAVQMAVTENVRANADAFTAEAGRNSSTAEAGRDFTAPTEAARLNMSGLVSKYAQEFHAAAREFETADDLAIAAPPSDEAIRAIEATGKLKDVEQSEIDALARLYGSDNRLTLRLIRDLAREHGLIAPPYTFPPTVAEGLRGTGDALYNFVPDWENPRCGLEFVERLSFSKALFAHTQDLHRMESPLSR